MCKAITELINRGHAEGRLEGMKSGIEQGLERGMERGIEQELRNIVANMLRHDVPDETIRVYTECSQDLIEMVRMEC